MSEIVMIQPQSIVFRFTIYANLACTLQLNVDVENSGVSLISEVSRVCIPEGI